MGTFSFFSQLCRIATLPPQRYPAGGLDESSPYNIEKNSLSPFSYDESSPYNIEKSSLSPFSYRYNYGSSPN